jgi:hypothetical protein
MVSIIRLSRNLIFLFLLNLVSNGGQRPHFYYTWIRKACKMQVVVSASPSLSEGVVRGTDGGFIFPTRANSHRGKLIALPSLRRAGLKALPHNAKLHYNFANFLRDTGQLDLAAKHYREALR